MAKSYTLVAPLNFWRSQKLKIPFHFLLANLKTSGCRAHTHQDSSIHFLESRIRIGVVVIWSTFTPAFSRECLTLLHPETMLLLINWQLSKSLCYILWIRYVSLIIVFAFRFWFKAAIFCFFLRITSAFSVNKYGSFNGVPLESIFFTVKDISCSKQIVTMSCFACWQSRCDHGNRRHTAFLPLHPYDDRSHIRTQVKAPFTTFFCPSVVQTGTNLE